MIKLRGVASVWRRRFRGRAAFRENGWLRRLPIAVAAAGVGIACDTYVFHGSIGTWSLCLGAYVWLAYASKPAWHKTANLVFIGGGGVVLAGVIHTLTSGSVRIESLPDGLLLMLAVAILFSCWDAISCFSMVQCCRSLEASLGLKYFCSNCGRILYKSQMQTGTAVRSVGPGQALGTPIYESAQTCPKCGRR
jgi:hypothetical protein